MVTAQKKKRMLIRRYMSIPALIDTLQREKLAILNPASWDDRNDRLFMQVYKSHKKAGGLYGLCAALSGETYHHWRIFAGGASGACLVLKRQRVEAYLDSHDLEPGTSIRYGEVKYLTLDNVKKLSPKDIENIPFLKRYGFKDEDEYRIVIETVSDQQNAIFIDCPHEWIDTVYLNPWLYDNQAQSLLSTLREIPGCKHLKIRRSELTDSTTWREAAERIAGKPHSPAMTLQKAGRPKAIVKPTRKYAAPKAQKSKAPKPSRRRLATRTS
ncbi:DUF2971 domain-containing protein [Mesorhizobium sp. ESP-6-4]|uniref:DUF2971 domain-containing protein n=1 Tax=Mesorhizobium sp. ESP-6-4 TaxID=2876624 RepID=UPI001CCB39EE|nr:DUF2971 domain-containing protein [Mesorhizobium sp. ESP-6-4]MBZ9662996.1 DUF2971 domain-containing protein [Mesorhizobium sp. ESP-6-4]